jgi:hypothetical protein
MSFVACTPVATNSDTATATLDKAEVDFLNIVLSPVRSWVKYSYVLVNFPLTNWGLNRLIKSKK